MLQRGEEKDQGQKGHPFSENAQIPAREKPVIAVIGDRGQEERNGPNQERGNDRVAIGGIGRQGPSRRPDYARSWIERQGPKGSSCNPSGAGDRVQVAAQAESVGIFPHGLDAKRDVLFERNAQFRRAVADVIPAHAFGKGFVLQFFRN